MKYQVNMLLVLLAALCCCLSCSKKYVRQSGALLLVDSNKVSTPKDCMNNVMRIDAALGRIRNYDSEKLPLSKTIDQYVFRLSEVDFKGCPDDFTMAFKKHTDAWLDLKKVTNKYGPLRGEMTKLFDILKSEKDSETFKILEKEILETRSNIEAVAK